VPADTGEEMQKILLAQAIEGMTLAHDIQTSEGRILCGKGTKLSETILSRLARLEIVSIIVEGMPVTEPGRKSLAEEMADIENRFSRVNDIAPLLYIKNRLLSRLLLAHQNPAAAPAPDANLTRATEPSPEDSQ